VTPFCRYDDEQGCWLGCKNLDQAFVTCPIASTRRATRHIDLAAELRGRSRSGPGTQRSGARPGRATDLDVQPVSGRRPTTSIRRTAYGVRAAGAPATQVTVTNTYDSNGNLTLVSAVDPGAGPDIRNTQYLFDNNDLSCICCRIVW